MSYIIAEKLVNTVMVKQLLQLFPISAFRLSRENLLASWGNPALANQPCFPSWEQ